MRTLSLDLGRRSYSIHIGRGLEARFRDFLGPVRPAVALVDEHLPVCQAERLDAYLGEMPRLIVPRGEGSKTLAEVERLARALLELGLGRDGLLVAVGGGVTGDLGGFIAASYFRGIPFIQIPSTLLAQVDSSVGGKVAVNLPGAKNSLGFFHQPEAVFADLGFLDTLDLREKRAGMAELVKMAAIADAELLDRLEAGMETLLDENGPDLEAAIYRACLLKAQVVEEDERESGLREILNFGHTLGHAIEGAGADPPWIHGEAVALGMLYALHLGGRTGLGNEAMADRMEALLGRAGLPLRLPVELGPRRLIEIMGHDKKMRKGHPRWVLLEDWGKPRIGCRPKPGEVLAVLESLSP